MSVAQCITGPRENEWGRGPQALMKDPTSRLEDSTSPGEHDADQGRAFPTPAIPDSITYPTRQTLKSSQIPNSLPRVAVSNFSSCPKVPKGAEPGTDRAGQKSQNQLRELKALTTCKEGSLSFPNSEFTRLKSSSMIWKALYFIRYSRCFGSTQWPTHFIYYLFWASNPRCKPICFSHSHMGPQYIGLLLG